MNNLTAVEKGYIRKIGLTLFLFLVFFLIFISIYFYGIFRTRSLYEDFGREKLGYNYYQIYDGHLEPVSAGDKPEHVDTLIKMYSREISYISAPYGNGYYYMLGFNNEIFIEKYLGKDSSVVKYIIFDTTCWGHINGFLMRRFLHKEKPHDSLIRKYQKSIENFSTIRSGQNVRNSKFGIQCN